MAAKVVYFHLRWRTGEELLPPSKKTLLVIAIAESKDGPFYLFEKADRLPSSHKFFKQAFEKQQSRNKPFTTYCNDRQTLAGITVQEYWCEKERRFKFKGRHLVETKSIGSPFSLDESVLDESTVIDDSSQSNIHDISLVQDQQLPQHHIKFSDVVPAVPFAFSEFSLEKITTTANTIKRGQRLRTFHPIQDEASLWILEFERQVSACNSEGLEKDVLLEFLDEVGLDFYYKCTRLVRKRAILSDHFAN